MTRFGTPRYAFDELDSTMETLAELARDGAREGTVVVTAFQRSGRGRAGRSWETPPGSALLCSLLLRPPLAAVQLVAFPLIAGLAIAEAIEPIAGRRCQLKWPNDVFLDGKKVCGVLMQTRMIGDRVAFLNLGFGINVSAAESDLPPGATSLALAADRAVPLKDVEARVMHALEAHYDAFLVDRGASGVAKWRSRAMYLGGPVEVEDRGIIERGRFVDVTGQGALLLETADGVRTIVAGDLTRGPRPSPANTRSS